MNAYHDTIDSPVGPLGVAADSDGALLAVSFIGGRDRRTMEQQLERDGFALVRDGRRTDRIRVELGEYLPREGAAHSMCRSCCAERRSKCLSGRRCGGFRSERSALTARSPQRLDGQPPYAPWDAPTRPIGSRSSFHPIGSSGPTVR